jgi:hypothetical protein
LSDPAQEVGLLHVAPEAVVAEVVAARSKRAAATSQVDLGEGRLLVYFPDIELADGAAQAETNGYLDVHNTPPWDSWVALIGDETAERFETRFLLAYVPAAFVESVGRGIWSNPEECLCWYTDKRTQTLPGL